MSKVPISIREWFAGQSQLMFRVKGTVILKIFPQLLCICFCTSVIVCVHKYIPGAPMDFSPTIIPIRTLGIVIGLLLVFRTNTAYDRYYEGRRIWSTMTHNIRVLTRRFWLSKIHIIQDDITYVDDVSDKDGETVEEKDPSELSKILIQRVTAINMLVAFAYATKNYLREEYEYDAEDLKDLMKHIPKFRNNLTKPVSKTVSRQKDTDAKPNKVKGRKVILNVEDGEEKPGVAGQYKNQPKTMSKRRRYARANRNEEEESFIRRDSMYMAHDYVKPTNIPLELIYYIFSYVDKLGISGKCWRNVDNLMESLSQFERILRTPMPLAYSVHLHHSLWLYLLVLPFQLVGNLGWTTIPVITLVAFALLGILAIGWEIENPFGYDDNDLPLDDFCDVIREEAQMIIGHEVQTYESFAFCHENTPFYPMSAESALELKTKSVANLRQILANKINQDY